MTTLILESISHAKNAGIRAEENANYTLTGKMPGHHDSMPWYMGSDIPAYGASVKATGFSLADGRSNMGDTFEEKWTDFKARVVSRLFIYVTEENVAYMMDLGEFEIFVKTWCYMSKESTKNAGTTKIRCKHESKKMRAWLATMAS